MFSGLSYEQITSIADQLNSKAQQMQSLLSQIEVELKKVGDDGTWSGTAASAAYEEFNRLIVKFPEFSQSITDCSTHLKQVVANFQAADAKLSGGQ